MSERLSPIPIGLLEVEAAAYPISTEAAFAQCVTVLDPAGKEMNTLWRWAESELIGRHTGIRIEDLTRVRDEEWFGSTDNSSHSLARWFRHLASRYLECRGATFAPKAGRMPGSDPRWIVRVLPPDLLAAGLWRGGNHPTRLDDLGPTFVNKFRDLGITETHLHLGAGLDFSSFWIGVLATLLDERSSLERFRSPGSAFAEGRDLADWLLRAGVTRQFVGEYLANSVSNSSKTFMQFLDERWCTETPRLGLSVTLPLFMAISDVMEGRFGAGDDHARICNQDHLRMAFRTYCERTAGYRRMQSPDDGMSRFDPLDWWIPANPNADFSTELLFDSRALAELERQENAGQEVDRAFELAFWQVTRIRNIYYRQLTQKALTPGLNWFVRHFDRIRAGRQTMTDRELARIAARVSGAGRGLRHFEFRTSPPDRVDVARNFIEDVFTELSAPALGLQEAGLVYHFVREPGGGKSKGAPSAHAMDAHANPAPRGSTNPSGYRFQTYARKLRKQATTIARLLARFPTLLLQLRGIDLCTDELAIPVWVFGGTFEALKDVSERVSAHLALFGHHVPPLRRTIHAGEDYPHLLTGLRVIHESVTQLNLQSGDRLGHALALGFSPERWAQTTGIALLSRETRLLDLAWEWDCRTALHGGLLDAGRTAYLERQIGELSEALFGDPLTAKQVGHLRNNLRDPTKLTLVGFPNGRRNKGSTSQLDQMFQYLTDVGLYRRGVETIRVDAASEMRAIEEMQTWVRGVVARTGLAVEINPTSNLLIANLGEWRNHPMFRMNPPTGGGVNPVPLVVGSDDPLVFATGLPEEYAALERALDEFDVPKPDASRWLEELRSNGDQFRFTLRESLTSLSDVLSDVPPDEKLLRDIPNLFVQP